MKKAKNDDTYIGLYFYIYIQYKEIMSIYANTRDIDNSVILTRPFKVLTQMYIANFNNVFHIMQ